MKFTKFIFILLGLVLIAKIQAQVTGTFTADNSYAVYVGNQSSVVTKVLPNNAANGHTNKKASEIFNPTQNSFSVTSGDYLYIIAWSDDSQCQGLLGEFTGNQTIKTGDNGWKVFPTKKNYGNGQAPSKNEINSFISTANSTSGWLNPFVGPTNANSKKACRQYSKVKGISNNAKWIWHNSLNTNDPLKVLGRGANHHEFLIFRFPVKQIIGNPTGGGSSGPSQSKCDCIPEDLYTVDITNDQFIPHSWTGNSGSFTYKLQYKPTPQIAALGDAWNAWLKAKFNNGCQIVHQYMLYEYTSNTPGVIANETFLEQFWSSPAYMPYTGGSFNTVLKSNKKYYIKHGVYYGNSNGGKCALDKLCPWQETRFFIGTSTGSTPTLRVMGERGKMLKEMKISKKRRR